MSCTMLTCLYALVCYCCTNMTDQDTRMDSRMLDDGCDRLLGTVGDHSLRQTAEKHQLKNTMCYVRHLAERRQQEFHRGIKCRPQVLGQFLDKRTRLLRDCGSQAEELCVNVVNVSTHCPRDPIHNTTLEAYEKSIWLLGEYLSAKHASNTKDRALSWSPVVFRFLTLDVSIPSWRHTHGKVRDHSLELAIKVPRTSYLPSQPSQRLSTLT